MLTEPAVLVAGLALFCYAALDVSFSNWLPAFGKETMAASRPDADPDADRRLGPAADLGVCGVADLRASDRQPSPGADGSTAVGLWPPRRWPRPC